MHRNKNLLFTSLFLLWTSMSITAQHGNVAAGGQATGTGGTMSFSIGQMDYLMYSSEQGSLSFGLQQPWISMVPQIFEIPDINIGTGEILCFNATETVMVAGDAKLFHVQSGGHADIIAGQNILMRYGTLVEFGGTLHAWISDVFCGQPESLLSSFEEQVQSETETEPILEDTFFKAFPNPTKGDFTLELFDFEKESIILIEIYTMQGRLISQKELPVQPLYSLSLADQSPGIYLICIIKNYMVETIRIVRQ